MELDAAVAAKWCKKHKIPPVPLDMQRGLLNLSKILLEALREAPDMPPAEVRVCYQSMKLIVSVAEEQANSSSKG